MKTLISNNGGYKLFAEIREIPLSKDHEFELRFTTAYEDAKDPTDEQVKFQLVLNEEALSNLTDLINFH
jgi:hypothetical protein